MNPIAEFDPRQQQVDTHSDPELREHGVPGRTDKGFDLEVLLDAFEKQLDLPAGFVDLSDGLGCQRKVVAQKHVVLAGFRITVADTAQRNRANTGFAASDENGLVTGQPLGFQDITALSNTVSSIALLSSDKENALVIQAFKPRKIDIGTIHGNNAAGG